MKRISVAAVILAVALSAGLVVAQQGDSTNAQSVTQQPAPATTVATPAMTFAEPINMTPLNMTEAEPEKKCGFDSDCPHGKCKSGKCGSCGFDSDCKGWGKCKKGWCGGCGFDSECKGFGKCSSGKCTKSPYK